MKSSTQMLSLKSKNGILDPFCIDLPDEKAFSKESLDWVDAEAPRTIFVALTGLFLNKMRLALPKLSHFDYSFFKTLGLPLCWILWERVGVSTSFYCIKISSLEAVLSAVLEKIDSPYNFRYSLNWSMASDIFES